jgi:hypothetical protein
MNMSRMAEGATKANRGRLLGLVILLWAAGVSLGAAKLLRYENTPGGLAEAPLSWPSASKLQRTSGLPTVVVMGHPYCPCTRSTIGELALLMTRLHGKATGVVAFIHPDGTPEHWEETDLWRSAAAIPGVTVISDQAEREADLFHAQASGQTFLYDADGQLRFNGGITAARGHSGDNVGRSSIVSLVTGEGNAETTTSVYGCELRSPTSSRNEGGANGR